MMRPGTPVQSIAGVKSLYFGTRGDIEVIVRRKVNEWFGYTFQRGLMVKDGWPVRVRLDSKGCVERVECGDVERF